MRSSVSRIARFAFIILSVGSCKNDSHEANENRQVTGDISVSAATSPAVASDSLIYSADWNLGDDPDYPDKSIHTRFEVRVRQFRSGVLSVFLDSAPAVPAGSGYVFPADSVKV